MSQRTSWPEAIGRFRLGWRLLRDPMVPAWTKLIQPGVVVHIPLPVDIAPDTFLGLGQLDDPGVILLGLRTFIALRPPTVVFRHRVARSAVDGVAHQVSETPVQGTWGASSREGAQTKPSC